MSARQLGLERPIAYTGAATREPRSAVAGSAVGTVLASTLRLTREESDRFTAEAPTDESVARSALLARAVVASGATVDTNWRWIHSIQQTEWAVPESDVPIDLVVERLHDSSFSASRLVRILQFGRPLALTLVVFDAPPCGRTPNLQMPANSDDWTPPASLGGDVIGGVMDLRPCSQPAVVDRFGESSAVWMRATEEVPDFLLDHVAALAFATVEALERHAVAVEASGSPQATPRQLSIRVHRGFRVDDWLLCTLGDTSHSNHRRLTVGQVHSSLGRLIATVSQESVDGGVVHVVHPAKS